jgi:hypothetical protein
MAGWNSIATAPREVGRPLLLYPRPHPIYEEQSEGPSLDLIDPAVKRALRFAKERGYIIYDELNEVLPPRSSPASRLRTSWASSPRWGSP